MRIHFVGIKGVGMAPLAIIAKQAGFIVTGSDIADAFITDEILRKEEIVPFVGFESAHIDGAEMVITTGAHGGYDNPEVIEAKKRGIPVLTQGEAVGVFMKGEIFGKHGIYGISVAGTHGKTTTTAMIATVLREAGLDPSWVIGTAAIPSLGLSGHFGQGEYFVAEADEYATEPVHDKTPKFLWQLPRIAVVTNIEFDHPDLYPDLESVREAFLQFVLQIPSSGTLVTCGDDKQVQQILKEYTGRVITYGFSEDNDYVVQKTILRDGELAVTVIHQEVAIEFVLGVSGEHNALNATAAYIVGTLCTIPEDILQKGLHAFAGTKRRLEYIGELPSGALLYDDYAHHPTEIKKTLQGLRQKYPTKKIICLFQPHTFSRTKLLFDDFISSFEAADEVVMAEIYPSQREALDTSISSRMLIESIQKQGKQALFAFSLADVVKYIHQKQYGNDTVIITMGAGDIYTIAKEIMEHESAPHAS